MHNYIIVNKLTQHPGFADLFDQRNLLTKITLNVLANDDTPFLNDFCEGGHHNAEKVEKVLVWNPTNALLNIICTREINNNYKVLWKKKNTPKIKLITFTDEISNGTLILFMNIISNIS